jgi:hypothetical protein
MMQIIMELKNEHDVVNGDNFDGEIGRPEEGTNAK